MKSIKPEEAGLSARRLARINPVMQGFIDRRRTAGIIGLIVRRGKVAYFETFGRRDIEANKPMTADTIFRIYSMTKPITSLAVMMLYEEGHFQLDDPIADFIPAFNDVRVFTGFDFAGFKLEKPQRPITIHDLLIHTSGLTYGLYEDSPIEAMYQEVKVLDAEITLEEMMQRLVKLPLLHHPGAQWRYSISTDVLGYLVEIISGIPFDRFLQEKIFAPLGLEDTGFYVPAEKMDRFAALYGTLDEGGVKPIKPFGLSHYRPSQRFFSGGGGLVSTAADYLRFTRLLLNGGRLNGVHLVSRKTIELMTVNHLPPALTPVQVGPATLHGYGFGLGFRVLVDLAQSQALGSVGEYGWTGAASTYFWIDPQEEMIGIFLTQLMPTNGHPMARDFKLLAYQAIED